jgi:hypothetical protein
MSASMTARMSAISPSASHRRPTVARTMVDSTLRLAKPRPAPYSDRARVRVSYSAGVGLTDPAADADDGEDGDEVLRKRVMEEGMGFVDCLRRERAALVNAGATPGGPVASRFRMMDRRLTAHVCQHMY